MSLWYHHAGASDLNSGGTDSAAPTINGDAGTPFVVTGGTNVFYAPGGINALTGLEAINLQIAGVSTVRKITKVDDNNFTLSAAVADASYNGRIGGARGDLQKLGNTGAGENAALVAADVIYVKVETITGQWNKTLLTGIIVRGNGGTPVMDLTGAPAGADGLKYNGFQVYDFEIRNAVDRSFDAIGGGSQTIVRCVARSGGGIGFASLNGTNARASHSRAEACGTGWNFSTTSGGVASVEYCEAVDCTGTGFVVAQGGGSSLGMTHCVWAENNNGVTFNASTFVLRVAHCVFEGNTVDGFVNTAGTYTAVEGFFINNVVTNNGTTGINFGALPDADRILIDYTHYHGNGADRTNWPVGAHDTSGDPLWVSTALRNYTPGVGSPLIGGGFSIWKAGVAPNLGATTHAADVPGGSSLVGGGLVR